LIGANGVGKSTLLRIVAGEDKEYTGTARVDGSLLYMRQFVASPETTVRQLLRGLLPAAMRIAGEELAAAELAAAADGSEGGRDALRRSGGALAGVRRLCRGGSLERRLRDCSGTTL
jgi:ATPase subunit of ABC transporter with duplicated ATPase domains